MQITKNPDNNIFTGGLNMDDRGKIVHDYTGGFGTFPMLAELVQNKPKQAINRPEDRIKGWYGVYYKPIITNDAIVGQVLSTALTANSTLTITWTDNTLDIFRVGDTVTDGTLAQNQGTVVATSQGSIVIQAAPVTGGAAIIFTTTTMFLPGSFVTALYDSHGLGNSEPKSNLMQTPMYIKYNTSVFRDNLAIQTFLDTGQTWMDAPVQGIKGTGAWWYVYQMQLAARIAKQQDYKAYFAKQGTITNSLIPGGMIQYSRGLRDSIMASDGSGGVYRPVSSALTQPILEEFINSVVDRRANGGTDELTLMMGRGAMRQIQNFTAPFVQYSGVNNTFGGHLVSGINVQEFSVAGVRCKFIMPPFLNNPYDLPTMSTTNANFRMLQNTIIAININATPRTYMNGTPAPSIEKVYYGPKCDCYYVRPGVYGAGSSRAGIDMEGLATANAMMEAAGFAATEIPQDSMGYITTSYYTFDAYDWGLLEQI